MNIGLPNAGDRLVSNDHVQALALQLGLGVLQQVVRLGGEPDFDKVAPRGQPGQDIRITDEAQNELFVIALLDLLVRKLGRPKVGHRRVHNQQVGQVNRRMNGVAQLQRGLHAPQLNAGRRCQRGWPDDQCDRCATVARLGRQCKAHPARRTVADEAHWIDRLVGAARADHHAPAAQRSAGAPEQRA